MHLFSLAERGGSYKLIGIVYRRFLKDDAMHQYHTEECQRNASNGGSMVVFVLFLSTKLM